MHADFRVQKPFYLLVRRPEASKSCKYIFLGLILSPLFFLLLFFDVPSFNGNNKKQISKEKKPKKWGRKREHVVHRHRKIWDYSIIHASDWIKFWKNWSCYLPRSFMNQIRVFSIRTYKFKIQNVCFKKRWSKKMRWKFFSHCPFNVNYVRSMSAHDWS